MVYQFFLRQDAATLPRNRPSPKSLPVYVQIAELLIRDIAAGRLLDGERLPPERDMAVQLDISVGTLRKALRQLTERGLLERIQGSGNYVRAGQATDSVYAMFRLELPQGGGLPSADVLSVDVLAKPLDLPEFGVSDRASRVRRLRYLNETIIAVEEIWLDISSGMIRADGLSDSLYHYYQSQLGFWITRAEDRVSVGQVPVWSPDSFTRPVAATVGYIERFSWADSDVPVEYSRTWFDPDRALYIQRLK